MIKNTFKDVSFTKIVLAFIALTLFIGIYYHIGCPIRFVTGIPCPGCGMTRAWFRVLTLHFSEAFFYHPLWILPPVFLPVYLFLRKRNKRLYNLIVALMIVAFLLAYAIRQYTHNPIVTAHIKEGLIYKLFSYFLH